MANIINTNGVAEPWVSDYFPASTTSLTVPDLSNYRLIAVCEAPSETRFVDATIAPISILSEGSTVEGIFSGSSDISIVVTKTSNTELKIACHSWGGWIYLIP